MQFPNFKAGLHRFLYGAETSAQDARDGEGDGRVKPKPESKEKVTKKGEEDDGGGAVGVGPSMIDLPGPIDIGFDGRPTIWPGGGDSFGS